MLGVMQRVGRSGLDVAASIGRAGILLWQALWAPIDWRSEPGLLVRQLHFVGVFSLVIVCVSGVLIGMVLALQGYTVLVRFGAAGVLGEQYVSIDVGGAPDILKAGDCIENTQSTMILEDLIGKFVTSFSDRK